MSKCIGFLKQLGRDEEGTALIEYSILLGIIALGVIAAAIAIGTWVGNVWGHFCSNLSSHAGTTNFTGSCT